MKNVTKKTNSILAKKQKAFSLIELSVVLVILSIIISGMLSISVSSANNNKLAITEHNIKEIYKAMGAFLIEHNRLPCPAAITDVKSTSTNYGVEESEGACADTSGSGVYEHENFVYGMVPVRTLGLSSEYAEDGYGSKFGYVVHKYFTDDDDGVSADYFARYDSYDSAGIGIQVADKGPSSTRISLINSANVTSTSSAKLGVFAIISYGANKLGAFDAESATQGDVSTDTAEMDNYPTNFANGTPNTADFTDNSISDCITLQASSTDGDTDFDDVIFFKTRDDLIRDFNAFSTMKCPAVAAATGSAYSIAYDGTYMAWDEGRYGQTILSTTDCPSGYQATVQKPGRRCGAFGEWEGKGSEDGSELAVPCVEETP